MGLLRLTRPARLVVDRWHRYTVIVDGEHVGRIADGETVEIRLPAGTHTVKVASMILFASRGCGEAEFTIEGEGTVEFVARARVPGLERFPWLHPNRWIELKAVSRRVLKPPSRRPAGRAGRKGSQPPSSGSEGAAPTS